MGEPAFDLSEIVELYKEDARGMVVKMRAALGRWAEVSQGGPARVDLRRLSHQLRGSGRTYGFRHVSRFAKALESVILRMEKGAVSADERTRKSVGDKIERLASVFFSDAKEQA